MPNTDLTGLFGVTLALFTLLIRVPQIRAFPVRQRTALWAAAVVVASIPLWGLSLSGFVRGITGDLSITTLLVLALAMARTLTGCTLIEEENRLRILRAVAIAAVVLYPFALGFTMFDPYRLGYGNLWFMLAMLAFTLWSVLRYSMLLALVISLAVTAWSVGWYESPNLWDYLLDPWLAVYAIVVQGKYWWTQRRIINA
jgi:hypothetical protein